MSQATKDLLFFIGLFIVFATIAYLFLFTPFQ